MLLHNLKAILCVMAGGAKVAIPALQLQKPIEKHILVMVCGC